MKVTMAKYYPEESARFAACLQSLQGQSVWVLGHQRPDGDCIGSTVALVRILRQLGVDAIGVNQDPVPKNLQSFVGDTSLVAADTLDNLGQIAITVDCADPKRVGAQLQASFPNITLNIDHHISNRLYAKENIVISEAAATAEILAAIALDLGLKLDAVTAQALYVGIATDTGQFRFASTRAQTFEIVQALIQAGADAAEAALHLYERESFGRMRLLQRFLDSLFLEMDGRICVGLIEDGAYAETGTNVEDAEGLVDYARSIEGVAVGVLVESRDGALKASLRAKDARYRVDQVARQFNGGGHASAAGLNVDDMTLEALVEALIQALKKQIAAIDLLEA